MSAWPRLTESLTGAKNPDTCQSCNVGGLVLSLWQECDERDEPEPRYLYLCNSCSEKLIEPHPRLYQRLHHWHPAPGAMAICGPCIHQKDLRCASPDAKANGGAGIVIQHEKPCVVFLDGRDPKTGRKRGWREIRFNAPPHDCSGRSPPIGSDLLEL